MINVSVHHSCDDYLEFKITLSMPLSFTRFADSPLLSSYVDVIFRFLKGYENVNNVPSVDDFYDYDSWISSHVVESKKYDYRTFTCFVRWQ